MVATLESGLETAHELGHGPAPVACG
jgi:hypothetical protein